MIIFKEKVSQLIQKAFEKFPKYEDGIKSLNMKFEVRSSYIAVLGVVFVLIAIAGFYEIIGGTP